MHMDAAVLLCTDILMQNTPTSQDLAAKVTLYHYLEIGLV